MASPQEIEAAIAARRRERDADEHRDVVRQLEVLREREDRARVAAEKRDALRAQVSALETARLVAIADAEAATRDLAAAIERVIAESGALASAAHQLSGERNVPVPLMSTSVLTRLSGRIAAILATVPGCRARIGGLSWSGHSLYGPADDWRKAEAAMLGPHLKPLMSRERNNGKGSGDGNG